MRNRILNITRNMIPYVKELNDITGNIMSSILMQQLDYWFDRYPDGFWKFLEPSPNHERYKPGSSWTEETGMSVAEFRTALDKIAHRYKSKGEFDKAAPDNKFNGRYYASYVDRRSNLTFYVRNHALVDQKLDELVVRYSSGQPGGKGPQSNQALVFKADADRQSTGDGQAASAVNAHSAFTGNAKAEDTANAQSPVAVNAQAVARETMNEQVGESHIQSSGDVQVAPPEMQVPEHPTTDATKEITRQQQQTPEEQVASGADDAEDRSSGLDLVYPKTSSALELKELTDLMELCPADHRQAVLDELEGNRSKGAVRKGLVPLAITLVKAANQGTFRLSAGVEVAGRRDVRLQNEALQRQQMELLPSMEEGAKNIRSARDLMANLPPNIRPRLGGSATAK